MSDESASALLGQHQHLNAPSGPSNPPPLTYRWEGPPEAKAKLVAAIAKAQLNFGAVERAAEGQIGHRRFNYAPLIQYTKASRAALANEGVITLQAVHTSPLATPERKIHRLTTEVTGHGASLIIELDFRPPKSSSGKPDDSEEVKDTQEWGKLTTYLRRYGYATVHVLDGEPDLDDGDKDNDAPQPTKNRQPPQPQPAPKPAAKPAQAREGGQKPAEPPKAAAMPTSVPTAELQAAVDRGTAELNGNGAAEPSVEPVDMEHHPDAPEDIVAMDGEALRTAITRAVQVLRHTPTTAQRRCLQVTGKPRSELTRADAEKLLIALRADILEQRESGM